MADWTAGLVLAVRLFQAKLIGRLGITDAGTSILCTSLPSSAAAITGRTAAYAPAFTAANTLEYPVVPSDVFRMHSECAKMASLTFPPTGSAAGISEGHP